MPTKILSAALNGLDAVIVAVEADSGGGDFGRITIVGLPDTAVSEARERVRSALRHSGFPYPQRKITVNLAPADLKKHGPAYDLPIAVSILALKNRLAFDPAKSLIAGELSLDGSTRPLSGALSIAMAAKQAKIKNLFLPATNVAEAGLIKGLEIFPVENLNQLILHLQNKQHLDAWSGDRPQVKKTKITKEQKNIIDLSEISGQEHAKRALEITAAGGHNLLFFGPPGSGKTLLAKSVPSILPKLTTQEKLEITKIYSAAGEFKNQAGLILSRPFRSPHHSASGIALIGGGSQPRPGEISLAHRGVLFLDEFPEFSRAALENLRQPLEDGEISISRAAASLKFPAKFMLIAAMNPCPCGYFGDKSRTCSCGPKQIAAYRRRLSGPIIDRIDLHVEVPRINLEKINREKNPENSALVRKRIEAARNIQAARFKKQNFSTNAEMTNATIKDFCLLDLAGQRLLRQAAEKMNLSARSYFRILKLARTIADLTQEKNILSGHLAEALQYRPKFPAL